ncbi:MAG: flagellar motor switch phosphatase FliY [Thermoleophilia bacterium]
MSGDSLSQEQIDALLKGAAENPPAEEPAAEAEPEAPEADAAEEPAADDAPAEEPVAEEPAADDAPEGAPAAGPVSPSDGGLADRFPDLLSGEERDTLGEIGNICMASAATTLSTLLGHQVLITTPTVIVTTEHDVVETYQRPAALVRINYTEGLSGSNVFVITTNDASVVADLMMGGSGTPSEEIDEIHASAVGEAMNQMMGASATSMANMLGMRVDISAPDVQILDLSEADAAIGLVNRDDPMVCASFDLQVGDLLSTTLMQLMPLEFAKDLVGSLLSQGGGEESPTPEPEAAPAAAEAAAPPTAAEPAADPVPVAAAPPPQPAMAQAAATIQERPGAVAQPAAFPTLGDGAGSSVPGDIGLLMDVPLQVSVELGRTELRIRNVLELVPGSIIELDRLAGEPVDVLVNGKQIARGEVVVIDEEFGIRITDIASQANRLRGLAD